MSTDVLEKNNLNKPKLPKFSFILAVAIELAIALTFIYERSILGVVLCIAYFWFSATLAMIRGAIHDE